MLGKPQNISKRRRTNPTHELDQDASLFDPYWTPCSSQLFFSRCPKPSGGGIIIEPDCSPTFSSPSVFFLQMFGPFSWTELAFCCCSCSKVLVATWSSWTLLDPLGHPEPLRLEFWMIQLTVLSVAVSCM
ncbi:hypothetical protein ATANTOWER_010308 [Ataeniobius toweri]|uniref:Uncharacterized protein n=1 Tax=Ataeniobius toweri TaxID=208326 RepID=A0ABU7AVE9_9TELE|nr:hypothetical protein [Ataeniobius toweri]